MNLTVTPGGMVIQAQIRDLLHLICADWHFISSPISAGFENWDFLDYFALTWNAGGASWTSMGGGAPNCIPAP